MNRNIFHLLKLEFALAIPTLNEWKIYAINSASQGLKLPNFFSTKYHVVHIYVTRVTKGRIDMNY